MSVASQKRRPFSADFIQRNRKNHLQPGEESVRDAAVLSHCSLLRNIKKKPTNVQEHCHDGKKQL